MILRVIKINQHALIYQEVRLLKKLAICIPTYNRGNFLLECLQSIVLSIRGYEKDIEVIISDNASTDNTEDIVRTMKKEFSFIRYYKNKENLGAEKNFYVAINYSVAEYIWILGDDDKIAENALQKVLDMIKKKYSLIISNYSIWSIDFCDKKVQYAMKMNKDKVYLNHNNLMKDFGLHLGYISSIIIEKNLFLDVDKDEYNNFSQYGFSFLFAVYYGINKKCFSIYLAEPLVLNRSDNSGQYNWFKYFITGSYTIFDRLKELGYSKDSIYYANNIVIKDFIVHRIIYNKITNKNDFSGKISYMVYLYFRHSSFWLRCIPLLFIPKSLMKFLKNIKKYLKKIKEGKNG